MGDVRHVEGPSISELTSSRSSPADVETPSIAKHEDFVWESPDEIALETEEKVLTSFWLAPGSWEVRAYATLTGGGDLINVGWLILKVEFESHSAAQPAGGSVGGKNHERVLCILRPSSGQTMPVTFSAVLGAQGKCSIKDIVLVAEKRA